MKILIRGAGDLATGIASRLYGAGHQILMTEIAVPLTVRRTVALSRAVYEGSAQVEEMKGVLVKDQAGAEQVMENGDIAVVVDEKAVCCEWFRPDVIVDAILAKKNLGTKITDAPFVIGVGPGFTATVWWRQNEVTLWEILSGEERLFQIPEFREMWQDIQLSV